MARSPKRRAKAEPPDPGRAIVDAAMALAAERGWAGIALADIAAAAGMPLLEIYRRYRSKTAILAAFQRRIDAEILAGAGEEETAERPRDRLFDVLMRRFDALRPYRESLRAIGRDAASDPFALLGSAASFVRSMSWMLEAAGIAASGLRGSARAYVLGGVYLSVVKVWLDDDSPDLMKTMAALDRRLRAVAGLLGIAATSKGTVAGNGAAPD